MIAAAAAIAGSNLAKADAILGHSWDPSVLAQTGEKIDATEWKPEFLKPEQNHLLVAMAERILPGSTQVQVNRIIDLVLSIDNASHQKSFLSSLAKIDQAAEQEFKKRFPNLSASQQDEVLTRCSSGRSTHELSASADPDDLDEEQEPVTLRDHFDNLKGWIVGAYYATEAGMRELGWTEDFYFEELPGCQHRAQHAPGTTETETTGDRMMRSSRQKN
jgi:hypothetical protein